MVKLILWAAGIIAFAYWKRHGFRRAWYILRTGAENPDWETLGGDYFVADWEKRRPTKSAAKEEAKAPNVSEYRRISGFEKEEPPGGAASFDGR